MTTSETAAERLISLGTGCAPVPENLLLAHARGEVLFIAGAGVSFPSKLPSFGGLVEAVYARLSRDIHAVLQTKNGKKRKALTSKLGAGLQAELGRFEQGDFDVVLGMLERRFGANSEVRQEVRTILSKVPGPKGQLIVPKPSPLHRALMKLADRGGVTSIVTTNFDRLLEDAVRRRGNSYSMGSIPRPSESPNFSGVMHIHGMFEANSRRSSELILTDEDFGQHYLRGRSIPDFIYDAARIFHLVLVGYSLGDAPMRYLLNAVAADSSRFADIKPRYVFFGQPVPHSSVKLEDWRKRQIIPVPYDENNGHAQLLTTLERWAEISPHVASDSVCPSIIKKIAARDRSDASDEDKDIFDHLVRRSNSAERNRIAKIVSGMGGGFSWLSAIVEIERERQ